MNAFGDGCNAPHKCVEFRLCGVFLGLRVDSEKTKKDNKINWLGFKPVDSLNYTADLSGKFKFCGHER
jgi:hypothetical protein